MAEIRVLEQGQRTIPANGLEECGGWQMPDDIKDYLDALALANKADAAFKVMVSDLSAYVSKIKETPSAAKTPPLNWPLPNQISQTYLETVDTRKAAEDKFNAISAEYRESLPPPSKIGR